MAYRELRAEVPGAVAWSVIAGPHPQQDEGTLVLPDGCMDLIWHCGGLLVAGPDTRAHRTTAAGARAIGLRFAPGVGPHVFGVRADELRDIRVPLEQLWPDAMVRRLFHAAEADPLRAISTVARDRLDGVGRPVETAIAARLARGVPVAQVAADVGWSERRLHRKSLSAFGYGPKTLARVLRFDRALGLARAGVPLARVAAEAGFSDHAHLAREVRALAGASMTGLLGQPGRAENSSIPWPSGSLTTA
ncbi:helix-turn-helix domain-containing protein [Rhodococcus sp. UNC363MFTsu5.1]|uniref:helix-turn-helix domain-containing protein n=1 Tax=Rhodococcus sp. UNC363MFTsu5.1 TaxID=1449069 RepID=UPI000563ADC9|nr:helix-turn-helix domain-containing protein [Rhodococcus sp. UNC363MFTsu5.1]